MSIFGGAPGWNPNAESYWEQAIFSPSTYKLGEKEATRASNLFESLLKSGADPRQVALDITAFSQMYPEATPFQTGSRLWGQAYKEQYGPQSKEEALDIANRSYLSVLGRKMTDKEKEYIKKERPSQTELAGLLFANPASNFAQAETPEEQKISAYYGRLMPQKDPKTGATGFSGARYGLNIEPISYTG